MSKHAPCGAFDLINIPILKERLLLGHFSPLGVKYCFSVLSLTRYCLPQAEHFFFHVNGCILMAKRFDLE